MLPKKKYSRHGKVWVIIRVPATFTNSQKLPQAGKPHPKPSRNGSHCPSRSLHCRRGHQHCSGKKEAVCDGNLVRVLSRIFAIHQEFKDGATAQKKLQPIAQSLIDPDRPGDYNQAMMELGATLCHRHSPLCLTCPALEFCTSGRAGDAENFPNLQKKKKKKDQFSAIGLNQMVNSFCTLIGMPK